MIHLCQECGRQFAPGTWGTRHRCIAAAFPPPPLTEYREPPCGFAGPGAWPFEKTETDSRG